MERPSGCLYVHRVQTKLALDLLARSDRLPSIRSFFLSISTTDGGVASVCDYAPPVLFSMRTPEGYSFTRNETMSLDPDTPPRRDQPRPRAKPDLTPTPPTTVISTPVPRTSDQDGEWKNRSAAIMMNRDDRRCSHSSILPRYPRSGNRLVCSHLTRHQPRGR